MSGCSSDGPSSVATAPIVFKLPGMQQFADYSPSRDFDTGEERSSEKLIQFLLASLQMQHLIVLSGSGTSLHAGGPAMSRLWTRAMQGLESNDREELFRNVGYVRESSTENIEELLSRCDALLSITQNVSVKHFRASTIKLILEECRNAGAFDDQLKDHVEFLRRLARRRARDSRLKLFTTNYDLCFDRAAGKLGLVPLDGFSFANPRRFDPRFFEYDIVRRGSANDASDFVSGVFLYLKLHGSVDWQVEPGGATLINQSVTPEDACLIYPASTKYQRSYQQPHLELMARYLAALREPNTCLLVVGFGFNDAHLSEPIFAALESNPHLRVIVVDPCAKNNVCNLASESWRRLQDIASRGDVAFINAPFSNFVPLIPDLRALSPAERLAGAVRAVGGVQ